MLNSALFAIWFLLPAALANATPIFSAVIPGIRRWQTPMDEYKIFRGKRLLGPHKTWRGLLSGILISTVVFLVQQTLARHYGWEFPASGGTHYTDLPLILGPLLGLGALGGDAIESFFKRQRGIESGKAWLPFDQLDYIIGALLISLPFIILPLAVYILSIVFWFGTHLLASYFGYLLHLKERPI